MQEPFKTFTGLISSINRNIRRIKTEIMANHNLKCPHVSTLYYLYVDGALTLKQLCEMCNEDKGAISRSVKSLEEEGLVESGSKLKKYKNKLRLTEKGKIVGKDVAVKIDGVIEAAVQGVSQEQRDAVYGGLSLISKNLQSAKIPMEKESSD